MREPADELAAVATAAQLRTLWSALGGEAERCASVRFTGAGSVPSRYPVSAFAAATIGAAGLAVSELLSAAGERAPELSVNRALSLAWFGQVNRPIGWELRGGSGLTGEYRTADGRWLRMQMNYPRHSSAVLGALGCPADRGAVAAAVAQYTADDADELLTAAGGAVAIARSSEEWARHPQSAAVAAEPLVDRFADRGVGESDWRPLPQRPLAGIRVLDMTRVLAGPMATRFLAAYGAEVLRIDPPGYREPRGAVLVTLGKRCARVDATTAEGRQVLLDLLSGCDVMVHGYRDGVLDRLGLGAEERRRARPGLVEVTLTAYGWSGPWRDRRGFDTLVEMAIGMALENQAWMGASTPQLLPVQALDHGTGHLMAAAAIRGLTHRLATGEGSTWRCALARTAKHMVDSDPDPDQRPDGVQDAPWEALPVATSRGPAYRLKAPIEIGGAPQYWDRPGEPFGTSMPVWATERES